MKDSYSRFRKFSFTSQIHKGKTIKNIHTSPKWTALELTMGKMSFNLAVIPAGMDGRPDLISNDVFGAVCDSERALSLLGEYSGLKISLALSDREYYAFAIRKDSKLKDPLNSYIDQIKKDGTYLAFLRKYFDADLLEMILE